MTPDNDMADAIVGACSMVIGLGWLALELMGMLP